MNEFVRNENCVPFVPDTLKYFFGMLLHVARIRLIQDKTHEDFQRIHKI